MSTLETSYFLAIAVLNVHVLLRWCASLQGVLPEFQNRAVILVYSRVSTMVSQYHFILHTPSKICHTFLLVVAEALSDSRRAKMRVPNFL
jgi:hypothetical protein